MKDIIEGDKLTLHTGVIIGNNITEEDIRIVTGNKEMALFMGADVDENNAHIVDHYKDGSGKLINKYVMGKFYFQKEGKDEYDKICNLWELKYNSSWDWLMPVVEKIESLESRRFGFNIDPNDVQIVDYKSESENSIVYSTRQEYSLKESIYEAVIQFIQWYNQQQK